MRARFIGIVFLLVGLVVVSMSAMAVYKTGQDIFPSLNIIGWALLLVGGFLSLDEL